MKKIRGRLAVADLQAATTVIDAAEIATGAVTTAKLAAEAVTSAKIAALAVETGNLQANAVTSAKIASLAVETGNLQTNAVTDAKLGTRVRRTQKYQYDFADLGGASGAVVTLTDDADAAQTIPNNAVVVLATLEGLTALTSGGAATVKLGVTGNDDALLAATAYNNSKFGADAVAAITAETPIKASGALSVIATIADDALTAGKFNVWVEYLQGD